MRYLLILGRRLHQIPMAQRVPYSLFPHSQHPGSKWHSDYYTDFSWQSFWQSQWHSDCYTDFFWQSFLTIPMAQRLLHRLLLAISFENPNGTATVTQTSFGNFFWQFQWHSDCYTDFFWQSCSTIPMAQRHPTKNQKVTKSSRDIAHSGIFVDFRKKFAPNTNGTACAI